jgi:hypothetical protein
MTSPSAARPNVLPGLADRAAMGEDRLVAIRDADGQLLRHATREQAEHFVRAGGGRWHGYGAETHIRLSTSLPPNSARPLLGRQPTAAANLAKIYRHNDRACKLWPQPRIKST